MKLLYLKQGSEPDLNALLTALSAIQQGMKIRYFALEKYPVDPAAISAAKLS